MPDTPRIISVDDHVVEPPDTLDVQLPGKLADGAPRVVHEKRASTAGAGGSEFEMGADDGEWADVWFYDDLVSPFPACRPRSAWATSASG